MALTANTRPRLRSGVCSWTSVWRITMLIVSAAPITIRAATARMKFGAGQFDGLVADPAIAHPADPLFARHAATGSRCRRQPAISGDLTPIAEVLVEKLGRQRPGKHRAERLEPHQLCLALPLLRRGRRVGRRLRSRLKRPQLFANQQRPGMLALKFSGQIVAILSPMGLHMSEACICPAMWRGARQVRTRHTRLWGKKAPIQRPARSRDAGGKKAYFLNFIENNHF